MAYGPGQPTASQAKAATTPTKSPVDVVGVVNAISGVLAAFIPTVGGIIDLKNKNKNPMQSGNGEYQPQIIEVPAAQIQQDYTPLFIAGGVGIFALAGIAILSGKKR